MKAVNAECFHRDQEAGRLGSVILRRKREKNHMTAVHSRESGFSPFPAPAHLRGGTQSDRSLTGMVTGVPPPPLRTSSLVESRRGQITRVDLRLFRATGSIVRKPVSLQGQTSITATEHSG